jgi:hypothetical protein
MSIDSYLRATEPAVRHFFRSIDEYDAMPLPNIYDYVGDDGIVRMTDTQYKEYMKQTTEFMDLHLARAIVAGSILQVAYTAIRLHSTNTRIPDEAAAIGVTEGHASVAFSIGRLIHEIPIGLIIYAGRIQYNHWEDGEPWNKVAREILREVYLVHSSNPLFDLAYDLEFPSPKPVSHYLMRLELKWHGYSEFKSDILEMLQIDWN